MTEGETVSIINTMDLSLSKFQGMVKDREAWCAAVHRAAKSWTRLSDGTTITATPRAGVTGCDFVSG